ncbi:DUF397 domain-containing protein [Kibdelosporangium banguiense]|uniref:DUF397 domain-containing protein n=1 Tax=Kibdelosporangium banguiense TaxID=1365924 RepID=UPI0027DDBAF6|nr:DUF397 domain-containing protein [Kibdelosporangium banguiense]
MSQTSWRKSSRSNGVGTDCVEVAWPSRPPSLSADGVLVRDSKNPAGPTLTIPVAAWRGLLATR